MTRLLLLGCVLALAASCSSSRKSAGGDTSTAATSTSTPPTTARPTTSVQGKWVNGTPAVSLGSTAQGFKQRSGTTWTADPPGTTTYVAYTRSDPAHVGAGVGDVDEVFTGSVRGI